jgi:hypothetical protein
MRFVFALLAVLALLANPAIAAAKLDCSVAMQQTANVMGMPGMAAMDVAVAQDGVAAPCCDPDSKQKHDTKSCAQMCAAMNAVAMTNSPMLFAGSLEFAPVVLTISTRTSVNAFQPGGLKRPPKRIA